MLSKEMQRSLTTNERRSGNSVSGEVGSSQTCQCLYVNLVVMTSLDYGISAGTNHQYEPERQSDKDRRTATSLSKFNHSKLPGSLILYDNRLVYSRGLARVEQCPGEFHGKTPFPTNGEPSREAESRLPATLVLGGK
jgi:hypothetical protein